MTLAEALAAAKERPEDPAAHYQLGLALRREGRLEEAAHSLSAAVRLRPAFAPAQNSLGITLALLGRGEAALASFREALRHDPAYAQPHNNLGKLLQDLGRLAEAEAAYREALRVEPGYAVACFNLGVVLEAQCRLDEAAESYARALRHRPDYAAAHNNLGNVLRRLGRTDDALAALRRAVALQPALAQALANLGYLLREQGKLEEAAGHLRHALSLQPAAALRVALATLLPPVYHSVAELEGWRERFSTEVDLLHVAGIRIDLEKEAALPAFFLAYQGRNDRELQRSLARLHRVGVPNTPPVRTDAGRGKIHVGFLSSYFRNHTIGRLTKGLIADLSRETFQVTVFSIGRHEDEIGCFIRGHADQHVVLPAHLALARQQVHERCPDILFYPEIGMDPLTYALALHRLAPVQCATWGHPVTSGMDTIDYFVSSELLDTEDAQGHYTERLVRLRHLAVCYDRPVLEEPVRDRASFGLPADAPLYGCLQSLFKLHPEFDELIGAILRRSPGSILVLLQGGDPYWEESLRRRFSRTVPDVAGRIHFLPPQTRPHFLHLNAVMDVLLDPIHFGGGNTTYEALALGVPVVTLPSDYLRGRITLALYRQMGVLDCVAADPAEYVELAVRLGTDPAYCQAVRAKLLAANGVLYGNTAGVRELEQVFRSWVVGR